jgi:Ser/Thr protein kinase RdoA (MazF antagonist)
VFPEPDPELLAFLREAGITDGVPASFTALAGGVSSDIWKVDVGDRTVCVKRALRRLKVQADWTVPVERNAFEVAWMRKANALVPGVAPQVLAHDAARGMFAMAYLDPQRHPVWKLELRDGRAVAEFAARIGRALVRIHAGTAGDPEVARSFATDRVFHDIRLEPYLRATARAHPDRAAALESLVSVTAGNRRALVHGDVSPKNILVTPEGEPVLLDAECAWYGDPAFDLAFCLNHLLLKCLWTSSARDAFLACFRAMAEDYLCGVEWEPAPELEARVARLLPGLLLGRVDGKSPVEYLTDASERERVRSVARRLLAAPVATLDEVLHAWEEGERGVRAHG